MTNILQSLSKTIHLSLGIAVLLFLYIFINCAMITGLIPIVGVPIPMLSYGGSAVISLCAAMGFVLNARRQRDIKLEGIINA